jgi:hypothetical protein
MTSHFNNSRCCELPSAVRDAPKKTHLERYRSRSWRSIWHGWDHSHATESSSGLVRHRRCWSGRGHGAARPENFSEVEMTLSLPDFLYLQLEKRNAFRTATTLAGSVPSFAAGPALRSAALLHTSVPREFAGRGFSGSGSVQEKHCSTTTVRPTPASKLQSAGASASVPSWPHPSTTSVRSSDWSRFSLRRPLLLTRAISRSWSAWPRPCSSRVARRSSTIAVSGRHVATHKSRVERVERVERAVPNLARFSALPKGLSDEQLEEVAVRRHLPQSACDSRAVLAGPISQ